MTSTRASAIAALAAILVSSPVAFAQDQQDSEHPGSFDSSGEFLAELLGEPLWRQTQPDYDEYYEHHALDTAEPSPNLITEYFSYVRAAGAAFRPRDGSTVWVYSGVGCIYVTSSGFVTLDLQLPPDSRIDYLRLYYYDTSASDSTAYITRYDGAGGFEDLVSVGSAGSGGYGTQLSSYLGHIVDNTNNSYLLLWRGGGSGLQLCGVRVAYRQPSSVR